MEGVKVTGFGRDVSVTKNIIISIKGDAFNRSSNVLGEKKIDYFGIPRVIWKYEIRDFIEGGFDCKRVVEVFKGLKVVDWNPSVFPDINLGARVDFPIRKRFKRCNTFTDTSPDPRGIVVGFSFVGGRGGKIFVFQGVIDRGIWSREDFTTVFGEKGEVERVKVFESKSSLFCREVYQCS